MNKYEQPITMRLNLRTLITTDSRSSDSLMIFQHGGHFHLSIEADHIRWQTIVISDSKVEGHVVGRTIRGVLSSSQDVPG